MHECPFCGDVCDCDIDDTWGLPVPDDCPHVCPEDDFEGGFETDQFSTWFDELEDWSLRTKDNGGGDVRSL